MIIGQRPVDILYQFFRRRSIDCSIIPCANLVDSDWAAHTGSSQTAVPVGNLVQILLVVALGLVEHPGGCDLCGDRAVAATPQCLLVSVAGLFGSPALLLACEEDRRAILRAYVVALAHPLRRVVGLPEYSQQVSVGDLLGVEDNQYDFSVSGPSAAHLPIGRVRCEASCVTDGRRVDAIDLPELALVAPEAAEAEDRGTQTLREWWLEGRAKDGVPLRDGERWLLPSRKRLGGGDHLGLIPFRFVDGIIGTCRRYTTHR